MRRGAFCLFQLLKASYSVVAPLQCRNAPRRILSISIGFTGDLTVKAVKRRNAPRRILSISMKKKTCNAQ